MDGFLDSVKLPKLKQEVSNLKLSRLKTKRLGPSGIHRRIPPGTEILQQTPLQLFQKTETEGEPNSYEASYHSNTKNQVDSSYPLQK